MEDPTSKEKEAKIERDKKKNEKHEKIKQNSENEGWKRQYKKAFLGATKIC